MCSFLFHRIEFCILIKLAAWRVFFFYIVSDGIASQNEIAAEMGVPIPANFPYRMKALFSVQLLSINIVWGYQY